MNSIGRIGLGEALAEVFSRFAEFGTGNSDALVSNLGSSRASALSQHFFNVAFARTAFLDSQHIRLRYSRIICELPD